MQPCHDKAARCHRCNCAAFVPLQWKVETDIAILTRNLATMRVLQRLNVMLSLGMTILLHTYYNNNSWFVYECYAIVLLITMSIIIKTRMQVFQPSGICEITWSTHPPSSVSFLRSNKNKVQLITKRGRRVLSDLNNRIWKFWIALGRFLFITSQLNIASITQY